MTPSGPPTCHSSITVAAAPEAVYALITDLPTLAELGEEIVSMRWRKGTAVAPGAVFTGRNGNGSHRWSTSCTVTDAVAGRRFAFDVRVARVVPIAHWRYDIVPAGGPDAGGCTVTESTWDMRPRWLAPTAKLTTGVGDRRSANAAHIEETLRRLKARAESS